jgi:growth factor-regulated tyrosine kinase substrate
MASISSWLWGTSQLDEAVDKATSELLPAGAEDIALNLEICDQIRSKSVPAKDAMRALKRRLNHKNPNVQILALGLTDICIKNGGDHFLAEVASREFMDNLVSILKIPGLNLDVKNNILRLVQNWSVAFEGKIALSYVGNIFKALKNEGFKFPPQDMVLANSAMVDTQTAPEWIDSDVCLRCRTAFSFTNRKHHCRNCGQVFDQQCSSKTMPLPHFGITQEVRVCDSCHSKLLKKGEKTDKTHKHSHSAPTSRHRSAQELADAELQRAIQLSLQEVGSSSGHARPGYVPSQPPKWQYSEPPLVDRVNYQSSSPAEEDDPDLKAAIEASLQEANAPKPSAPVALETPRLEEPSWLGYSQSYPPGVIPPHPSVPKLPNYDLEPLESDVILTFSQTVEQVQEQGGRDMSRYPAVTELYDKANGLRPKLAMSLDDAGRKEEMLSEMHEKLSQAVKLYDQLLTQQVSHPRWRSPQPAPFQQTTSSFSTGYNTVNGYNQWAAPNSPRPVPLQPQSPQRTFSNAPPTTEQQVQPSYYAAPPAQVYATEVPQQQGQQQHFSDPPQQAQQYSSSAPPPPASILTAQSPYTDPSIHHEPYSVSSPASLTPQYNISGSQTPSHSVATSAPFQPPTLPAQQQISASQLPPQSLPHLSRHNTTTHASPPSSTNAYLPRSNTMSHPRSQFQQYAQPSQPALPEFPVAPTSTPQTFSMYGPAVPSGIHTKEALLIDL